MFGNNLNTEDMIDFQILSERSNICQNSTPQSQNKYIEQFLQHGVLGTQKLEDQNNEQKILDFDKTEEDSPGFTIKTQHRRKSKFHNYQKHLIITLRKTVKIQTLKCGQLSSIVNELWKAFCSSKIYNKSLLRILFGQSLIDTEINLSLFKKEGFNFILQKYQIGDIKNAQIMLRRHVLNHFEQNSLDNLLNSRKLPDLTKQLFKKYIYQFIVQLRQGCVMKRLPKSRKTQIFMSL